jgi:hypothetical protein
MQKADYLGKYEYIIVLFVETPRKFITAKLSIRKPGSSSVLIIWRLYGGYMEVIWRLYEGYMVIGGYMEVIWLIIWRLYSANNMEVLWFYIFYYI